MCTNVNKWCKLCFGAVVSEHQTNQSSLKIQENQKGIDEPNSKYFLDAKKSVTMSSFDILVLLKCQSFLQ